MPQGQSFKLFTRNGNGSSGLTNGRHREKVILTPGAAIGKKNAISILDPDKKQGEWPRDVEQVPLPIFDTGVFITELANKELLPKKFANGLTDDERSDAVDNPESLIHKVWDDGNRAERLEQGTYRGTQLALTKTYDLIEKKYGSFMDTVNFEPTVPSKLTLAHKRQLFVFTDPDTDEYPYPPHLNLSANESANEFVPKVQSSSLSKFEIFNAMRLAQLTTLIPDTIPRKFIEESAAKVAQTAAHVAFGGFGRPDQGNKLSDVEEYQRRQSSKSWYQKDIFDLPNIGRLEDWYSDARFAQQFFTGTNPTTIEKAGRWVNIFIDAATHPGDAAMGDKIAKRLAESPESLYVQDYSYIRKAAGYDDPKAVMSCRFQEDGQGKYRYNVAPVCLFNLTNTGELEPLAVIIDWRGSAEDSVFIYNRELALEAQGTDWAWRYAKTCVMSSDWIRHEVTVHLCRTHLVEEATIVAANRTLPQDHDVYQILYPHWQKTLSLNAAARTTLMPSVITPLMGMETTHVYKFLLSEYEHYDFKGSYIPRDLESRGFPPEKIAAGDRKYHNYAWARCILSMWHKIRRYVQAMLRLRYTGADPDLEVRQDEAVQNWSNAMRAPTCKEDPQQSGANLASFPEIKGLDDLIDAVTMCIHIASPQHTSINYLQNYYQSFVVNRPPALYAPPPKSRDELMGYVEDNLVAALPMNHPHDWLLASHIPYLLSFKPGDKESLIIYAASKYHVYKHKQSTKAQGIREAAKRFYMDLADSEEEFQIYGKECDDSDVIEYEVLSPSWNAVSILI